MKRAISLLCGRRADDGDVIFSEPDEKRTEDNDSDANQTAELCDADTVESSLPPDSRHKRLADLQAERAACDPTRLQTLKVLQFFQFHHNHIKQQTYMTYSLYTRDR